MIHVGRDSIAMCASSGKISSGFYLDCLLHPALAEVVLLLLSTAAQVVTAWYQHAPRPGLRCLKGSGALQNTSLTNNSIGDSPHTGLSCETSQHGAGLGQLPKLCCPECMGPIMQRGLPFEYLYSRISGPELLCTAYESSGEGKGPAHHLCGKHHLVKLFQGSDKRWMQQLEVNDLINGAEEDDSVQGCGVDKASKLLNGSEATADARWAALTDADLDDEIAAYRQGIRDVSNELQSLGVAVSIDEAQADAPAGPEHAEVTRLP